MGRKMDLPIFSDDDAHGWLVRAERYFRVAQISLRDRLDLVLVAMEGEALTWFEWWEEQTEFPSWRRFKEDLLRRFQPGEAQNPMGALLDVKQTGSVMQYRREFELVARTKKNIDLEILMCIFMNGLKKEVRAKMTVGEFRNLTAMMDRALELEQRNLAWVDAGVYPGIRGAGGPSRGPGPFRTQPSIRHNVGNTQGGGSKSDIGPESV